MTNPRRQPLGERIRSELEGRIVSGDWPPGHRVPPEHALMEQYSCSRMTVNKALSGMAAAGLIVRRRRAGSFVADPQGERAVMKIQDFASEAAQRGLVYTYDILSRRVETPDQAHAAALGLHPGSSIVRVRSLHRMNGVPSAYEDRIISLAAVPAAQEERFHDAPPGTWLLHNVPWTEAEHVIRARNAGARLAAMLGLKPAAACLVLERRTWHQGALVTVVTITYPADRHRFTGRFSPTSGA
ncbi:histidine utilization repressor [Limobrevibacterium gyesilva]|uniref:Histidine utilization repressor n=1 Tax=Limobrevibacterium gyesilva TaxID=2991712 RepID=A0AA42CEY0_9PROT|nr:histidine utilization repressor [Limobrevibacterium gyesilva]MCW3476598.1 histidine utilization repressor [Limobrevibacterium gyesilva]